MKILVTGVAGFIGTNLAAHCIEQTDYCVVGVDKLGYASSQTAVQWLNDRPDCSFYPYDIRNEEAILQIFHDEQPDAIIHLAAESHVDRSIDGPDEFIGSNIVGTYRLLKVARQYYEGLKDKQRERFRFLHVSTDEVFGSLGPNDPGFNELSQYQPNSPYSASKAASDHLARAWCETYGLPVIITNCSNNYGPWQFPEKLIPVVVLKAIDYQPIPIYGKGDNVRDWLFVRDHTSALLKIVESGKVGCSYNIGGQSESTNLDLVKSICETLDRLVPIPGNKNIHSYSDLIEFVQDRPGHDFRYAMDITKIKSELGWEPHYKLTNGLEQTVAWYLENKAWCKGVLSDNYELQRLGLDK